ncbi:MAG: glycoside hydrolase family 3 C-terminal domain-containing protein [Bryobacteraceae bacterium]
MIPAIPYELAGLLCAALFAAPLMAAAAADEKRVSDTEKRVSDTERRVSDTEKRVSDTEKRVSDILKRMTTEEKIDLIGGVDGFYIRAIPRLGLPKLKTSDGPMGARNDGPATTMAGGIALAATWNPALAERVGGAIAADARARGVHFMLGPGVNIYVAPMNGRNFEYFGEDPFLGGRIAVSYIEGMQKLGVSATIKHFMGNNSEFDRHNVDAIIDERAMREIYLPIFEAAVKRAHAGAVMDSYNLTNGQRLTESSRLNTEIAKQTWGFDGIMMSDWWATYDGVAAANGGLDLEMPAGDHMNRATLLPAIEKGQVSMATIDDKVRRILRVAVRFGWLDREQTDLTIPRYSFTGAQVALQAARESMVLLKNEGNLLPIDAGTDKTIALIGPGAYPAVPNAGGSAGVKPFAAVSFLEGLTDKLGARANVLWNPGLPDRGRIANSTEFTTEAGGGEAGLKMEIFANQDLSGAPSETRIARHINVAPAFAMADLATGADFAALLSHPHKATSMRWSGYYTAKTAGVYEVFAESPTDAVGGYRLYLDGKPILDGWTVRKAMVDQATLDLAAGPHQVVFEKYQGGFNFHGDVVRVGIAPQASLVDPVAKAMAAKADVVVLAVGFNDSNESEGGDRTFQLPIGQDELIREISAINKKTVVVITAGGGVDVHGWLDRVPGLIYAWYPGQAGGTALAEILLGDVNPSGRLPISIEKRWEDNPAHDSYYPDPGTRRVVYRNGVFVGYRGYEHNGVTPAFAFGQGLSYTTFRYGKLAIKPGAKDGMYEVTFEVTNTGKRAGAEVAQLYIGDSHASVPRPPKELKGFAKVELKPGETKQVSIALEPRAFTYYDVKGKLWRADPGEFDVLVGRSSATIELKGKIHLGAPLTVAAAE